jgi:hypothetical protein
MGVAITMIWWQHNTTFWHRIYKQGFANMGIDPSQNWPAYDVQNSYEYGAPHASSSKSQTAIACRKRKASVASGSTVIDLTQDTPPKKRKTKKVADPKSNLEDNKTSKKKPPKDDERRLRRWRNHAPSSYLEVRDRALTQRMFVLDRRRDTSNPDHPSETISLAGTTGNVYTIVVDKVPSCDCPHARKGNQCKHIAYVLARVLRAPSNLQYQLAFVSSELRDIFTQAPPLPSETAEDGDRDGKRKSIEGECPICCVDFEPSSGEHIVYCRAACGNNIHAECFRQWAASKTPVTCPFCRSRWESDAGDAAAAKDLVKGGRRNGEGYVNVAAQLGLSGRRDYSTYHSHWVRNQARRGEIEWDEDGVMQHEY